MSTTVTRTRGQLIDEALSELYRSQERPLPVVIGAGTLDDATDTSCTFDPPGDVRVVETSILEHRQEQMLVIGKSSDSPPVFTLSRSYAGSDAIEGAAQGVKLLLDPTYKRADVARYVEYAFDGPLNTWLPAKLASKLTRTTDKRFIELPADTLAVEEVRYMEPTTGHLVTIDNAVTFHQDLPVSDFVTGKALRIPSNVGNTDSLYITTQVPYAFTPPTPDTTVHDEDDTIEVPVGATDLPSLYAAAYSVFGREISRSEVDTIEEWAQDEVIRTGANVRLLRELWITFYRRLDEARRTYPQATRREYRSRTSV